MYLRLLTAVGQYLGSSTLVSQIYNSSTDLCPAILPTIRNRSESMITVNDIIPLSLKEFCHIIHHQTLSEILTAMS